MTIVRPFHFAFRLGAVFGLALAVLPGCNESNLRNRVDMVESRLDAAVEKPAQSTALPANATPIRYSVEPLESHSLAVQAALQQATILAAPSFSARRDNNGKVTVSGIGSFGENGEKWFIAHAFLKQKNGAWERSLNAAEASVLERKTVESVTDATKALEVAMRNANEERVGAVVFINGAPVSGNVISTGNSLDFCFADNPAKPELFIDAGAHQYLRGGRLVFDKGRVRLANHPAVSILDKPVPDSATHFSLSADGTLSAYDPNGSVTALGPLPIVLVSKFKAIEGGFQPEETAPIDSWTHANGKGPCRPGYLEISSDIEIQNLTNAVLWRNGLLALQAGLTNAAAKLNETADTDILPLIVHTPLPKTAEHLKALKIPVEKTNERTSIGTDSEENDVANALVLVLQGLRKRMAVHEENLRNAGKTRDAEGHLNAYRRKTVAIGPQGNIVEGVDKSELPKNYKPGDPDAGPDGFVVLSNVNKTVETAEFKAAIEEYKLVRSALERLAPKHIFPDPPTVP